MEHQAGTTHDYPLQYPTTGSNSSRTLTYSYGTAGGENDAINRLDSIVDGYGTANSATTGETLAEEGYLGLDTIVTEQYEQPQIALDYAGSTPGSYPGLDQFNRAVDKVWEGYGSNSAAGVLDEYQLGYDLQSDVAYRRNVTAGSANLDQIYNNDYLSQLTSLAQGALTLDNNGKVALDSNGNPSLVSGTQDFTQSWTLDGNGNWTAFSQTSTTDPGSNQTQGRASNALNQITAISGSTWAQPLYDGGLPGPGNMTTVPQPGNEAVGLTCTYDAWNHLVNVAAGTTINVGYGYDALGREITRTDNTAAAGTVATTDLYYAGQQLLETTDRSPLPPGEGQGEGPANGATAVTQQYVWSARYVDSPVESDRTVSTYSTTTEQWTAATDRLYYLTDANNNVTAVTNASGVVQERYSYDAYGTVTVYDANWTVTGTTSAVGNTLFFAGMNRDPTTGLDYDRARWYNSSTGGYLSADPVRSDKSLYRYVGNDPIGEVDPSGAKSWWPGALAWTAPGDPGTPQTPGPNPTCGPQQGPGDTGTVPTGYGAIQSVAPPSYNDLYNQAVAADAIQQPAYLALQQQLNALMHNWGPAVGLHYATERGAALAWAYEFNGQSIIDGKEYGSSIYQNPDGTYSYTEPNVGTVAEVTISMPEDRSSVVATVHSHVIADILARNEFSPWDKSTDVSDKMNGYLATSNGSLLKHDWKSGNVSTLSKNIPSDKNDPDRKNQCPALPRKHLPVRR